MAFRPLDSHRKNGPRIGGQVYSWGSGEMGQLGFPSLEILPKDQDGYPYQPMASLIQFPQQVVEIAGGDGHTSAVTDTGKLYSWGASACGQLGHSDTDGMPKDVEGYPYQPVPLRVETLASVAFIVKIACGDAHTVALCQEGRLYSWGGGGCGQLGHNETSKMPKDEDGCPYQPTPRIVDTLRPHHISNIACGKAHTVAVSEQGRIFTWGAGACGQLGHPDTNSFPSDEDGYPFQPTPREVEELSYYRITETACGDVHTLSLTDDGLLYSFGGGSYGQLGVYNVDAMPVDADNCPYLPTPHLVEALNDTVKLACGDSHSLTVDIQGRVFCWGANSCGQLGIPNPEDFRIHKDPDGIPHLPTPAQVEGLADFRIVDIACGEAHSLAVTSTGDLYSWGACSCGQLGLSGCDFMPVDSDGYPYQPVPTLVTNGFTSRKIIRVACGGVHNLAITIGDNNSMVHCLSTLVTEAESMHADIAFILEEGEYVCAHLCILKVRCSALYEYVMQKLASPVSTTVNVNDKELPGVIVDAKKTAMADFLHFVYTSNLMSYNGPKSSPMAHIMALYSLASRFKVAPLLPLCRQAVRRQLARRQMDGKNALGSDLFRASTPIVHADLDGDGDDWKIFFLPNGKALVVDNEVYQETVEKGTLLDLSAPDDEDSYNQDSVLEQQMFVLLNDFESADVTLKIPSEYDEECITFRAHAAILASRSQYFQVLFCSGFKEETDHEVILPSEMPENRIRCLLEFIYADRWIENDLEFAKEMVPIADRFAVLDLKQMCERTLITDISVDNVAHLFAIADRYTCERLRSRCLSFITGPMFHYVMKTTGFAELPKELIIEALQSHKALPANPQPTEPAPGAAATSGSKSGQTQREKLQGDMQTEHRRRMASDSMRMPHGVPGSARVAPLHTTQLPNDETSSVVGSVPTVGDSE